MLHTKDYYNKRLKTESDKLCALRAKNVLAYQCALRAYVSRAYFLPTDLRAYVPTCQCALHAYVLTCQRALLAYVPRANIPSVLTCLPENVSYSITLIHM